MAYDRITPQKLGGGALATAPAFTTVYTVPDLSRTIAKDILVCNTTSAAIQLRLYLVDSGGSPSTSNAIAYDIDVPANGIFEWSGTQVLHVGDSIQANGSASGLTIRASGGEAV